MNSRYDKNFLLNLYRTLYTIRVFETRCIRLYRQGLIRGYLHPYLGEEAIAVGVCAALKDHDYIVSTHRGHGHSIARGADLARMTAEITGKSTGYCKGRGGSMHIADVNAGNLGANGIVGAGIPIGVGAGLGTWIRGEDRVTVIFSTDGASNHGTFGESLNLAAVWNLPVILVVENNQYAVSTRIDQSTRETDLHKRGIAYGVENHRIDGNDVLEVYECAVNAVEKCRSGKGPILIEAVTYRHSGHHVNDHGSYMPEETLSHYLERDPCSIGRKYLTEMGGATEEEVGSLESLVERLMEEAVEFAKNSPDPDIDAFFEEVSVYS